MPRWRSLKPTASSAPSQRHTHTHTPCRCLGWQIPTLKKLTSKPWQGTARARLLLFFEGFPLPPKRALDTPFIRECPEFYARVCLLGFVNKSHGWLKQKRREPTHRRLAQPKQGLFCLPFIGLAKTRSKLLPGEYILGEGPAPDQDRRYGGGGSLEIYSCGNDFLEASPEFLRNGSQTSWFMKVPPKEVIRHGRPCFGLRKGSGKGKHFPYQNRPSHLCWLGQQIATCDAEERKLRTCTHIRSPARHIIVRLSLPTPRRARKSLRHKRQRVM